MADGGQLRNVLGAVLGSTSADVSLRLAGAVSSSAGNVFDAGVIQDALGPPSHDASSDASRTWVGAPSQDQQGGFDAGAAADAFALSFMMAPVTFGRALTTSKTLYSFLSSTLPEYAVSPLVNSMSGIVTGYAYVGFGVVIAPTRYKMRAVQSVSGNFEYWTASGTPSLSNPSGLALVAGSLTVVAVKLPTQT